ADRDPLDHLVRDALLLADPADTVTGTLPVVAAAGHTVVHYPPQLVGVHVGGEPVPDGDVPDPHRCHTVLIELVGDDDCADPAHIPARQVPGASGLAVNQERDGHDPARVRAIGHERDRMPPVDQVEPG